MFGAAGAAGLGPISLVLEAVADGLAPEDSGLLLTLVMDIGLAMSLSFATGTVVSLGADVDILVVGARDERVEVCCREA